jgi:Ca2+-binding EF-hand superfamily protein
MQALTALKQRAQLKQPVRRQPEPTPAPSTPEVTAEAPPTPQTPTTPSTPVPTRLPSSEKKVPTRLPSSEKKVVKKKKKRAEDWADPKSEDMPERLWRVAGPYRGMCGDVHMLHRCFFDSLSRNPLSLMSTKGMVAVIEDSDASCTAVLQLDGAGRVTTLCHRIARYCIYMSRKQGGGPQVGQGSVGSDEKLFSLQASPEFIVNLYDRPFHCKVRLAERGGNAPKAEKHTNAAVAAEHTTSSAFAGTNATSCCLAAHLELQIIGVSKPLVLRLLQDGSAFVTEADLIGGAPRSSKSTAAGEGEHASTLVAYSRSCISMAETVGQKGGEKKGSEQAGVAHGITLLDWDLENKCFHPPVRTEELDQETSLIELVLEWVEVASGRSQTQLSESSKKRLQSESNVNLEKKGLSLKERTALKQYLAALVGVRDAVKQINSTALLCSTFIAIGARQDLIRALHRILQGVGRVRNHNKKNESEKETREEVDIEEVQIIKIDPVLCGPNAILKRHSFKLSDILNECEALSSRVGVLLGPELQEDSEDLEAEQEPKKAGPDSWQGRNMAALSALAKAMRLEHFPASKVPGAITVIKETRQLKDVQLSIEMDDPMQINELTLHFIALRLPLHVRVVFMTIDFYSIPRVRTGPLTLSAVKGDALRSVRSDGLFPVVPDSLSPGVGNNLTITITPEMAGSNRPADFAHYLCSHDLDIDVWDAESCLALGTLRVSKLHRLLRQGQSAVQILATPSFAIDVPLDEPVLSSTSGRESQYDMLGVSASSGEVRPGALIRIVNRGLLVPTPATGENPQGQEVVKSWRSDLPLRLPPMAGSTDSDQKKQGMSAILHARKYSLARDRGKISGGNVVPIEMNALAVAEQHASALRAYRHNPAYQLQGMQEMIQKLSVKDVEIRPGFGQTDFGYTHPIVNPHNQTVVCTAAMTEVDLENVALEMRDDIIKGMRIGGGALEPSRTNESVPQQAQSWLIQPSAQVALTVTLDNRPENWQLGTYKFTIQITLMSPNQLASQYDLRVTVKPLPVVFDRWLRFFVDSKQFERQMDVPVAILQAGALLSVRTFPGAGVRASISDPPKCPKMGHFMVVSTGKSETYTCDASICHAQKSGERWHCAICSSNFCFSCKSRQILCKLSVNMESEAFCELHKPSSNVSKANKLPGWERQNVGIVVVTMSDRDGEIRQRWKVEVLSIHPATTDARRKSVDVQLSSSIQDKILSLHRQFYSSNPQLLPCYRTGALLAPTEELELEEPSPTFELARGFNRPCFVLLVTQKDKYKRLGNAFGEYYCDSQLVVDDAYGVTMACRLLIIEKVLGEVRTSQKPSCSDSQWQRIQESGVQNIKGAAVNFGRRNPTQEDLVELLRLVRQALQEYCNSKRRINSAEDLPKACRDASLDQRPRDDEFFLAASGGNKAPDAAEAAKQQAEISARVLEARTVGFGTVVGVWRVRAPGSAAPIESDEEVEDEEGTQKQRTGPKPAIMVESVYHCWLKPKERDSEGASRRLQAAALEKHVYKGDHSKPLRQHFSVFQRHQELIHKYPDLTADDRPAGPFLEAVMAESRIFLLMSAEGEGKEGFLTRDEALNSLTEVAWSFEWGATGQYGLRCQGLDFDRRQAVNVPPSVSDIVRIGKDAGGVLMSADDYCRARKKAIATFCKVHSWDAIGGVPQLYYGRGMDLEDAHKMRAAAAPKAEGGGGEADEDEGAVVLEASRTDDDQPDPLECVVVTSAPLHLDMEHFDLKDFMLDSKSGAKRSPLSSRRFPHLFRDSCVKDETGAMCIPSYKEAKSIKELGFKAIPPGGQKLKRRRARIFSDDLRRHGWNACEVLDHVLGKDGVWRHKVQFDDGRIEELALDAMSSAVKELVPDPKRPDEDVLINARALVACLVEDLQLVLSSFAEMVKTFNRKYTRTPEAKGFLKATSLPYIFRCAPGAREMMAEMLEPLLKQALQKVLLEDSGGFCKNLGAIELPLSWKDSFPNKFATMHSVRPDTIQELFGSAASAPGVGTGPPMVDHSIDISFGKVQDILVFGPQDLWAPSGARLPGVLVFSEALAVPCSARHLTGWAAEDCVESFVGDHTDVRLMQNFWFNHSLLDKSRFKPVAVPQSAALELSLEDLREANNLFRLIDTDNSKTLETAECSAYLEGVGYLDDEIEAFFAKCDENCDGSISWSEFLLGAATLYKKQDKDDKTREQLGAEPNTLQVAWEDSSSPIDVDIDSGMPWRQVQERTVSAIEASSGKPMVATSTRTAQIFFEYTNIAKARALVDKARLIFDQIDLDQSGELDRKELMSRLRLPKTVGGWGFEEYQVDDFISDADSDRNGSVDRVEFVRAAARFLLADKVHKADDHWLSGLRFEKEHLRLRCRDETEWAAMQRASIFPTREQRRRAIAELRKRLKLPLEDDASESEARSFTASKHAVQKRLKFVRAELDSVRKLVEQDKAEIEKLKDPKTDEDKKKKAALDEAQRERVAKENAICKIIAHLEPELKSWEAKCKQKKQELGAVEDTRRELFKNEQMRVLNSKGEQAIADVCNMCTHGTCAHSMHKGSEEAMQEVVSALYTHLKAKLRDMNEALDKDEHDTDAPGADIRVLPCFKYNLRCLLHSSVKLTTEVPSEWKEVKDKLGEVSWKNVYSGEERLEKPAAVPVLVNTASQRRPSFLRHFKDWKRSGVLLQVSDTTSWREMKQALLPKLLHERLKLVSNEWVTVRSEEEWEEMKAALLLWKTLNTRIVVVREAPRAAKKQQALPAGWQQHNILPKGWARIYDDAAGKFKYVNTSAPAAEPRWEVPLDCLDAIQWPDDSVSSGKDLAADLGPPPDAVEDHSVVVVNWAAQVVAWLPPRKTADVCAVRVRIAADMDGKVPTSCSDLKQRYDIKDGFVPILLMEQTPAGAAKESEGKEALQVCALARPRMFCAALMCRPCMICACLSCRGWRLPTL